MGEKFYAMAGAGTFIASIIQVPPKPPTCPRRATRTAARGRGRGRRRAASEAVCVRSAATARSLGNDDTTGTCALCQTLWPPRAPMPGGVWLERPGEEATCWLCRKLHTTKSRSVTLLTPALPHSGRAMEVNECAGIGCPPVLAMAMARDGEVMVQCWPDACLSHTCTYSICT